MLDRNGRPELAEVDAWRRRMCKEGAYLHARYCMFASFLVRLDLTADAARLSDTLGSSNLIFSQSRRPAWER